MVESINTFFSTIHELEQPKARRRFYLGKYVLLVLLNCVLIVLWLPDRIFHAQLYGEDGVIFFAQAFNLGPLRAFPVTYAGYYHFIPRLLAAIGVFLPFSLVPLFYCLCTILITSLCIGWFYLPHFRSLVQSDLLRLTFVLLLPFTANADGLTVMAYLQWYIFIWCFFVVMAPLPKQGWLCWVMGGCYMAAIVSAPTLIVLLPIWVLRFWFARNASQRVWIGLICFSQCLIVGQLLFLNEGLEQGGNLRLMGIDIIHGFLLKVIGLNLLGYTWTTLLYNQGGWLALYILATMVGFTALTSMRLLHRPKQRFFSWLLIYIIVATVAMYATRSVAFAFTFAYNDIRVIGAHARYFFPASAALYLFILVQIDNFVQRQPQLRLLKTSIAAGCLALIVLHTGSVILLTSEDTHWTEYARLLTYLDHGIQAPPSFKVLTVGLAPKTNKPQHALYLPLIAAQLNGWGADNRRQAFKLPTNPPGWFINLQVDEKSSLIYHFIEGPTLLGVDPQVENHRLRVRLFWQGNTLANVDKHIFYTAYVHLVDQQYKRLAGYDVELKPPSTPSAATQVFYSMHELALPSDIAPGDYQIVIGLYHFEGDQIMNGSSILMLKSLPLS